MSAALAQPDWQAILIRQDQESFFPALRGVHLFVNSPAWTDYCLAVRADSCLGGGAEQCASSGIVRV
jgi:hypothetical protein